MKLPAGITATPGALSPDGKSVTVKVTADAEFAARMRARAVRARAERVCEAFCRARVGPGGTFEFEDRTYTVGEDGTTLSCRWERPVDTVEINLVRESINSQAEETA